MTQTPTCTVPGCPSEAAAMVVAVADGPLRDGDEAIRARYRCRDHLPSQDELREEAAARGATVALLPLLREEELSPVPS